MTTISIFSYSNEYCIIEASNNRGFIRALVKNDKIILKLIFIRIKLAYRNLLSLFLDRSKKGKQKI